MSADHAIPAAAPLANRNGLPSIFKSGQAIRDFFTRHNLGVKMAQPGWRSGPQFNWAWMLSVNNGGVPVDPAIAPFGLRQTNLTAAS